MIPALIALTRINCLPQDLSQRKIVNDAIREIIEQFKAGSIKDEDHFYNLKWMQKTVLPEAHRMKILGAEFFKDYADRLQSILASSDWSNVALLAEDMKKCWLQNNKFFSAAMAAAPVMPFTWPMIFFMALQNAMALVCVCKPCQPIQP